MDKKVKNMVTGVVILAVVAVLGVVYSMMGAKPAPDAAAPAASDTMAAVESAAEVATEAVAGAAEATVQAVDSAAQQVETAVEQAAETAGQAVEDATAAATTAVAPACDFAAWVGQPVNEDAVKALGRPFRVLKPGDAATMDFSAERININTDDAGVVTSVTCG